MPSASVLNAWLHLLKKTLVRFPVEGEEFEIDISEIDQNLRSEIDHWVSLCRRGLISESGKLEERAVGKDWPETAETMLGLYRMNNIETCLFDVAQRDIPGDVAEIGAWRGGAGIFMAAILYVLRDTERKVWVADSFQGLPKPDPYLYPVDAGDKHWASPELSVSLETVKQNFLRYGLLNPQVKFLPGWFRNTLPSAPIERIALLHLDCDIYESTIIGLESLYPKVSPGGYIIVDDYFSLDGCSKAVDDYRAKNGITTAIEKVDWSAGFWRVE